MNIRNISRIGANAVRAAGAAGAQRAAAAARPAAKDVQRRFGSSWSSSRVHGERRMEELANSVRSGHSGRASERVHTASRAGAGEEQALPEAAKAMAVSLVAMGLLLGARGSASCDELVVPASDDGRDYIVDSKKQ
mmetsp:Transcript_5191/g.12483  ORF Transcript_5191/g.12483 Transcript_5191/m.12483 type:complete len:136 (-) Transcript_5191:86-493(-)